MSWKALEEQYTNSNGKHLLPYGCSESPRRKNSRPSDNEDEQVERVTGNDTYQKGEIDAGVCNGTNGSEGSGGSEGSSGSEDSSGIQIEVSSETSCELDREGSEETVEEKGAVVESPCDEHKGNDRSKLLIFFILCRKLNKSILTTISETILYKYRRVISLL